MNVPDHLRFADSHEYFNPNEGESGTVGISDHAQAELSDVVYLELPEVGRVVAKGEAVAVVESVKAANDIYAPISGEIVEINEPLGEAPEPVNEDPYGAGWMFKIKPSDPAEIESLFDAETYRSQIS